MENYMKHIIHTGMFDIVPNIIRRIDKITEKDNGLMVDATIDTEKLDKFKEDLDTWIRSERAESSVLEVPKGHNSLRVTSFVLTKEVPDDFDVIEELEEFCEEHCVLDIRFIEREKVTSVIVVYKD